jgi:membrane protein DedA with SNARE-associated domain
MKGWMPFITTMSLTLILVLVTVGVSVGAAGAYYLGRCR